MQRSSLTRQVGALASGSLATQASYLLLMMALTRLAPKSQLGGYQQLQLIYGILSPLLIAGIPAALLYFIPRSEDREQSRAWVGEAYVLLGLIGLLVSIAIGVWRAPLATALGNSSLESALLIYAPQPFFAFLGGVMSTALVAVGRAGLAAATGAVSGVLALIGVVAATLVQAERAHGGGPRRGVGPQRAHRDHRRAPQRGIAVDAATSRAGSGNCSPTGCRWRSPAWQASSHGSSIAWWSAASTRPRCSRCTRSARWSCR